MSFWNFLFGKNCREDDENVGHFVFCPGTGSEPGCCEATMLFRPTGSLVNLTIEGSPPEPAPELLAFYREIEAHYPGMLPALTALATEEYKRAGSLLPLIKDFATAYLPTGLHLVGGNNPARFACEISFATIPNQHPAFTVRFRGLTPYLVQIDD